MERGITELIELLKNEKWQTRYNALNSLIYLKDSSALKIVKNILNEDENEYVREIAVEYLKLNDSFPLKPINTENVKLYRFPIKNTHTILSLIKVAADPDLSENEAKEDIKYKLKQEAAQLGANAVIKINCGRKFLFMHYKAKGYAVLIKDAPEKVQLEKSNKGIFLGIVYIIWGLISLFNSTVHKSLSIFFLGSGLIIFTDRIFQIKHYRNQGLYLIIMSTITISMLILIYITVFI